MAKKISKSNKTANTKQVPKENMVSKVEVKKPMDQDQISRIVGTIFISLGVLLIGFGVYSFVQYRQTPQLDTTLEAPYLVGVNKLTNGSEITIKGVATDYEEVFIYIGDEEIGRVSVDKDGGFEYVYAVDAEGTYDISIAGVKGFPKRLISGRSSSDPVVVDRTAPEIASMDYSSEVGTETFTLVGVTEPLATVSVKRGIDSYSATADDEGNFKVIQIALEEGPNVFNVEVQDVAGNIQKLDEKVRVTYSPDSDVNGDAVTDDSLPVAAGNLDDAMEYLFGNTLMMIFGLTALVGFAGSTVYVLKKSRA